ncbi:MAG: hypothetical protein A4E49_01063 [Methanosaeta sp. PtaU1.Bin112]|nr:MAG: hypothetical protein A4E49_01063 [Methanosaeta sp. PtaU1.Bin112]
MPIEVFILLSAKKKIETLGFQKDHTVRYIIRDMLDYYLAENELKDIY